MRPQKWLQHLNKHPGPVGGGKVYIQDLKNVSMLSEQWKNSI